MKIIITLFLLVIPLSSHADELVCPKTENEPWDKMKESSFAKDRVQLRIAQLQEYFSKSEVVAEEYIYESLLIIEGGALRQSIEYWKGQGNAKNAEHWRKEFCKFMSERAYLVH